jgi:hypothetical protein
MDDKKKVPPAVAEVHRQKTRMAVVSWMFILAGLAVLAFAVGSVAWNTYTGQSRLDVPGDSLLKLREGGVMVLPDPTSGRSAPEVDMRVTIKDGSFGARVSPVPGFLQMPGGAPVAARLRIEVPETGTYQVQTREKLPLGESGTLLLIHESLASNRTDIVTGALVCGLLILCGIVLLVVTHRAAKKALAGQ